jgi:fatty acid/phospholipid biosynthesis enzyme
MGRLLTGFAVGLVSLAGTAALLALARLVLVQVRGLTRPTRQIADPHDQAGGPWVFADCGQPPGWALPPIWLSSDLER